MREQVHWAEDSWLLSNVSIYSDSLKEQERNYKKLYAIDWGLANKNSLVWDGAYSRAFENMVFIHLYQKWHRIHYYLTKKKRQEVDFITVDANGRAGMAVQVCMDIDQENTLNRELEPIIATAKYFDIKENLLITYNREKDFHRDGILVKAIPAWKWMLND